MITNQLFMTEWLTIMFDEFGCVTTRLYDDVQLSISCDT